MADNAPGGHKKEQNSGAMVQHLLEHNSSGGWGRLNVWFEQFVSVVCTPAVYDAGEM